MPRISSAPYTNASPQHSHVPPRMSGSQPSCPSPQSRQKPGLSMPVTCRTTASMARSMLMLLCTLVLLGGGREGPQQVLVFVRQSSRGVDDPAAPAVAGATHVAD